MDVRTVKVHWFGFGEGGNNVAVSGSQFLEEGSSGGIFTGSSVPSLISCRLTSGYLELNNRPTEYHHHRYSMCNVSLLKCCFQIIAHLQGATKRCVGSNFKGEFNSKTIFSLVHC